MSDLELTALIRATDQASGAIRQVGENLTRTMGEVERGNERVEASQRKVNASSMGLVKGFSGVATSALALYGAVDRVQDMQVSVDRANLQVKTSLNAVEDAQRRYNDAVEKYGPSSEEAAAASRDLQLAQERYTVAIERAQMMQGNLTEMLMQSAVSVTPIMITAIDSIQKVTMSWGTVTAATSRLISASIYGIPLIGWAAAAVAAVGAIIAIYGRWRESSDELKRAQEGVAEATEKLRAAEADAAAVSGLYETALEKVEAASEAVMGAEKRHAEAQRRVEAASVDLAEAQRDLEQAQRNMGAVLAWLRGDVEDLSLAEEELAWSSEEAQIRFGELSAELGGLRAELDGAREALAGLNEEMRGLNLEESRLRLEQAKLYDAFKDGTLGEEEYEAAAAKIEARLRDLNISQMELRLNIDEAEAELTEQERAAEDVEKKLGALSAANEEVVDAQENLTAKTEALNTARMDEVTAADKLSEAHVRLQSEQSRSIELYDTYTSKTLEAKQATDELKQAVDALQSKEIEITVKQRIERMPETGGWGGSPLEEAVVEVPAAQHGFEGIVSRPTLILAGEAGPEHVRITPGVKRPAAPVGRGDIVIKGPLVNVEGAADRRTAELAARIVVNRLRNVVVEASSASGSTTHKRIRLGSVA